MLFDSRMAGGDHVWLLTPAQINRFDKAQVEGRRARQVTNNVIYTGGFLGMLASYAARAIPLAVRALPTIFTGITTGLLSRGINIAIRVLLLKMVSIYTNMINAIEYGSVTVMVST